MANIFARETLEERPNLPLEPPEARRPLAAMLFRREPLAVESSPAPTSAPRPGLLRALFAPEVLPEDPPAPERPGRAAWLRWLFRFERLDPP